MALVNPGAIYPNGSPRVRGTRSRAWGVLRALALATTGCSRLYRWLWEREFYSLLRDNYRRAG